ncbi:MAG: hypothetical protein AB1571_02240 [Nanoarchaeota archaeon]
MDLSKISQMGVRSIKYLNKGKRSVVFTGIYNGKAVAIKIEKQGIAAKNRIKNEAKFLKILNKHSIGPKLITNRGNFVIYELVKGKPILEFLKKSTKNKHKKILKQLLKQCYTLDKLKINKKELHNPIKHIIIDKKPIMIDFERCYYTKNPKNVTQFCQFLLSRKLIDKNKLKNVVKNYKRKYSKKDFDRIYSLISV